MADDAPDGPDDLKTEFIFVKRGDPPPLEWMALHPGWVKFPAVMIPRDSPHHPNNRAYKPVSRPAAVEGEAVAEAAPDPSGATAPARKRRDRPLPPVPGTRHASDPIEAYRRANDAVASYLAVNAALDARGLGHSSRGRSPADAAQGNQRVGPTPAANNPAAAPPSVEDAKPSSTVIFIGGFADGTSAIVSSYFDIFKKEHTDITTKYFSFDSKEGIIAYINSLKPGSPVTIVGHSWGGDTAMEVVNALPPGRVQTLVTIDPVGSGGSGFLQTVAQHAGRWIDVEAVGGGWLDPSNLVARVLPGVYTGSAYGKAPSKFTKNFVKSHSAHGEFGNMMAEIDPATGQTIENVVAGIKK